MGSFCVLYLELHVPMLSAVVSQEVEGADWVARNRAYKRNAARWAKSQPGPRLCVLKTVMAVMASLIHRALQIAGAAWQEAQERRARAGQTRSYRMLEAAVSQDLRDFYIGMVRVLLQLPRGLSLSVMTLDLKLLLFRVASKAMCALHILLRRSRRMNPYSLFLSLLTLKYDETTSCMWDALRSFFQERYPEFTNDAKSCLEAVAETLDRDISGIEARHALSRRITVARSVQTWAPKLAATSAEFTVRQVLLQQGVDASCHPDDQRNNQDSTNNAAKKKKVVGGGGGMWRAYLHEQSQGRRFTRSTIQELSEEFRNLSESDKAYYKDLGNRATLAHRHGYQSFGERAPRRRGLPRIADAAVGAAPMDSRAVLTSCDA